MAKLKNFKNGQRVKIIEESSETKGLIGRAGTVIRIRTDSGAWVRMDEDLPDSLRSFPANDENGRGNDIVLYTDECEAAT